MNAPQQQIIMPPKSDVEVAIDAFIHMDTWQQVTIMLIVTLALTVCASYLLNRLDK